MDTLHYFSGDATHEDSLDGVEEIVIISEDIPSDMKAEVLEDKEESIVQVLSRKEMDSIAKSIDEKRDIHQVKNGYILDLVESFIVGVN